MTETWAGLLRAIASEDQSVMIDHYDGEECYAGSSVSFAATEKLRRLASLLEQITPEMVDATRSLGQFIRAHEGESAGHWNLTHNGTVRLGTDAAALLAALSTAPTEETEP